MKELKEEYFDDNITSIVNDIFQARDYENNYKTILKELKDIGYTKDEIFVIFEKNDNGKV